MKYYKKIELLVYNSKRGPLAPTTNISYDFPAVNITGNYMIISIDNDEVYNELNEKETINIVYELNEIKSFKCYEIIKK